MQSAPYFKVKCDINLLRDYEYEGDAADNNNVHSMQFMASTSSGNL